MTKVKAKPEQVIGNKPESAIEGNTRAQWVERIRSCPRGRGPQTWPHVASSKGCVPHGEFTEMIENDLPFTASTAHV